MKRFRVGPLRSLVVDYGYVIQEKKWWGWSEYAFYYDEEDAIYRAKKLEKLGYKVDWYL